MMKNLGVELPSAPCPLVTANSDVSVPMLILCVHAFPPKLVCFAPDLGAPAREYSANRKQMGALDPFLG